MGDVALKINFCQPEAFFRQTELISYAGDFALSAAAVKSIDSGLA